VSAPDHERYADDVGGYLLGALPELQARAFERHVMACAECRDEVERLRPAAAAIARSVEQFEPPPNLRTSLMTAVEAEAGERAQAPVGAAARQRRRPALPRLALGWPRLAWAAAALVLVGAALGLGIDRATRGGSSERSVTADTRLRGARARLVVRDGSQATLRVSGLPVLRGDRVYEVWIQHGMKVRPAGALFEVHSNGDGAAAVPRPVHPGDRVMVTRERAGGVPQPTEVPIINARV
jgi:anti-sigma-K factor RskA